MKRMNHFLIAAALCACLFSLSALPAAAQGVRPRSRSSFPDRRAEFKTLPACQSCSCSEALEKLLTELAENGTITPEVRDEIAALLPQPESIPETESIPSQDEDGSLTDAVSAEQAEASFSLDEETLLRLLESGVLTQEEYDSLTDD